MMEVLNEIAQTGQSFTERDAATFIHQVLYGLTYMHEKDFIHRDLKMENVMVDKYIKEDGTLGMNCKLVDFGFATTIKDEEKLNLALGTPLYMAPEIVKEQPYD